MVCQLGLMLVSGCALLSQAAYSETGNPERGDRPSREAMLLGFIHQANQNEEIGSETGEYAFYNVGTGGSGFGSDFQATMDKLRGLKGPDFDREFARAMIKAHQSLIDRLNNALTPDSAGPYVTQARITDPDAIKLVEQLLPTVKQHLSLAKKLNDGLNG